MGGWKSLKTDSGTGWKEIYREAGSGWRALTWENYYKLTFESGIEGFSCGVQSSTHAYEGTYSFLSGNGVGCSKNITQRTRPYYWEFKFYIPTGETGSLLEIRFGYTASSVSLLIEFGYPTSGKIGYYDTSWHDSGMAYGFDGWHTLKIKINSNDTFDCYYDATTVFTGKNTSYHPAQTQQFHRLDGKNIWIDNIREYSG